MLLMNNKCKWPKSTFKWFTLNVVRCALCALFTHGNDVVTHGNHVVTMW